MQGQYKTDFHLKTHWLFAIASVALLLLHVNHAFSATFDEKGRKSNQNELKRDTLFLTNGEILIGEIQGLSLGMVNIDSKGVGLINLKISKIKTINSNIDTLRIETTDMTIYYGALKPNAEAGKVYVVTENGKILLHLENISSMIPLHNHFIHNLRGSLTTGFSYSHSSGIGQITMSGNIQYIRPIFELSLSATSMSSIDTSTLSRDREELTLSGFYNIHKKLYIAGAINYERNLELSIARRFQETVGPAWKFVFNPNTQLIAFSGISMNQEQSTNSNSESLLFELPVGFRFNFFKFSNPNIQFSSSNEFYISLSQKGRVRYDNSNTLSWEIIRNFDLSLSLYLNYDRRPPDNSNTGKVDYGIVQGFTYKF